MKLTKKDKMMLLILGVVILIAVFYMYGIKPAKTKIAELDATITEKTAKATEVDNKWNEINAKSMDKEIAAILDYYYDNKKDPVFADNLDKIGLEKKMYEIFKKYEVTNFRTAGWNIEPVLVTHEYAGKVISGKTYTASVATQFSIPSVEQFNKLVDMFKETDYFVLNAYSLQIVSEEANGDDVAKPEDQPGARLFNGTMTLTMYMRPPVGEKDPADPDAPAEDSVIPPPLPSVGGLTIKDAKQNVIVFTDNAKAKGYEFYSFTTDNKGRRYYVRLNNVKVVRNNETKKVEVIIMTATPGLKVAVRAIGDNKEYYKSLLNDSTPYVEFK